MNKDIMYVDFKRHRKWFSLRLCCLQSFDYEISPILQEFYSLKIGCTTSCIIFGIKHLLKVIILYALRRL